MKKKEQLGTGYFHKHHISGMNTNISIIKTMVKTPVKSVFSRIKLSTGKKGISFVLKSLDRNKNRHH